MECSEVQCGDRARSASRRWRPCVWYWRLCRHLFFGRRPGRGKVGHYLLLAFVRLYVGVACPYI